MNEPTLHQRAGNYQKQSTGYKAFIPVRLPPFHLENDIRKLQRILSDADRVLGRLDGATEILPNPDLFIFMYVRKEAALSSQIEDTQASLQDLLAYESQAEEVDNPDDVEEISNYVKAINLGLQRLREDDFPFSKRLVKEIHTTLMQGVRGQYKTPGEFRTTQNWIGPRGCTLNDATFVPPPPEQMEAALDDWEKFLHDKKRHKDIPVLIRIGLMHAQFETIHPFLDGNGRIGRLLITLMLCEGEFLHRPTLYLSAYFKEYKSEYYRRLQNIRDKGDWEGWLRFFLEGVRIVAIEATNTARDILRLREDNKQRIFGQLSSAKASHAMRLHEALYSTPIARVETLAKHSNLTYAQANAIIPWFLKHGILKEKTGNRRNRIFRFEPYLDLFE